MRLIEVEKLKDGMVLGRTIYGSSGQILLQKGMKLRGSLIEKICNLDMGCAYIEDEFSSEIEVFDVIDERLRQTVISKTKSLFVNVELGNTSFQHELKEIDQMISQIVEQVTASKSMMVNLLDLKTFDDYTFQHSVNVCVLATIVATAMNHGHIPTLELAKGALFHDIGKMFISKNIMMKPGKLTTEEFEIMKTHPTRGAVFARMYLKFSDPVYNTILGHHERCDGRGYPEGRQTKGISKNAKIVAICDVYDAITSKRVYHEPAIPSEAFEYIMGNVNQHFDEDVVKAFMKKIAAYPLGMEVLLNNGMRGLVCENKEGFSLRPKIKIFTPPGQAATYVDLSEMEYSSLTIVGKG